MHKWYEQLIGNLKETRDEVSIFTNLARAAKDLGFEYCAFGLQLPYPLTSKRTVLINNYSVEWQQRYQGQEYVKHDPTILRGRANTQPFLWTDELFSQTPDMWEEARAHGLEHGWSQSCVDGSGSASLLSLARSNERISQLELQAHDKKLRWLVSVAHLSLTGLYQEQIRSKLDVGLTERELEILRWSADGKSAADIGDILSISKNTVNFHIKNAVQKLQTSNKTAAVAKAVMMGLLF